MENQITSERISTLITGTILGKPVQINYDNAAGELPTMINGVCRIPEVDPIANPMSTGNNINISVSISGQQDIIVNGIPVSGNIDNLVTGIETIITAILT